MTSGSGEFHPPSWMVGITDDEGSFFAIMRGVREFEDGYEKLGLKMFGFSDGQSEAFMVIHGNTLTIRF